ncbi:MAG: flavodoxin-dependent (E)-4-hydroxy-3-methylbut-2-enyl-diphosphate synthase, partial [Pontibacter sp.]|nr:flavodoxin-dependent (E)-4-hydroxy-3-methylbut-2-enyl-diphosphate synthase [Pontibacter sp.]
MVESALEFIRICEDEGYYDIVISMKASNTQVMVQAYRLLVQKLEEEGLQPYPLHLGVTEAGEAEDGRIKSAVGIGTLLEDGLGDTVRVSLTEAPEAEAPVAQALIDRYTYRAEKAQPIQDICNVQINPFQYHRRETSEVENIGASNVPRVVADLSRLEDIKYADLKCVGHLYSMLLDKFNMNDLGADYIYTGKNPISFMLPNGLKEIVNYEAWLTAEQREDRHPLIPAQVYLTAPEHHAKLNFILATVHDITFELMERLKQDNTAVLMLHTTNEHAMPELRKCFFRLMNNGVQTPCIIKREYGNLTADQVQLYAATDVGGLLIDGLGDGVMLSTELLPEQEKQEWQTTIDKLNNLSFGILQAARTRMSKTEYISCPSCGRTLFDLQETTAMIRKRTDHLKGVKIGIMGCIVNGPGEMADADYGYVGVGKDKIA